MEPDGGQVARMKAQLAKLAEQNMEKTLPKGPIKKVPIAKIPDIVATTVTTETIASRVESVTTEKPPTAKPPTIRPPTLEPPSGWPIDKPSPTDSGDKPLASRKTQPAWKLALSEKLKENKEKEGRTGPRHTAPTVSVAPDISSVTMIYRGDDRGPKDLAINFRGFSARQAMTAGSAVELLKEICADGVDSWMGEWVGGGMMGTKPCVSTTSNGSGFGPTKKFFYEMNFGASVGRQSFTAEVLGFVPPTDVVAKSRKTSLFLSGTKVAGSATIILAYAEELLFLTPVPEAWITRAKSYAGNVWKPFDPGTLRSTVNKLTDDLTAW